MIKIALDIYFQIMTIDSWEIAIETGIYTWLKLAADIAVQNKTRPYSW